MSAEDPSRADVVIVGAGIIGCALARELAASRMRVTVIERLEPGKGASGAAAGILSPQAEADGPSPLLELGIESRAMFPGLVEELKAETGAVVPYRTTGTLYLALDNEAEKRLERRFAWQSHAGLPVERLSGGRVATLEPAVAAGVRVALLFPYDHQIDNVALTCALAAAAETRGAVLLAGVEVTKVVVGRNRVLGVDAGGMRVHAPCVVICAGAWSGSIDMAPASLPVVPVRGQMVALEAAEALLDHVVYTERGYLVPRLDGRVLIGSTTERAGFQARPTAAGIGHLLDVACSVVPSLRGAFAGGIWAGLRPGTPDGLPVMGPAGPPWPEGLWFATGHYRSGILLAPVTARLVAEAIVSGRRSPQLEPFSPRRFAF